MTNECPQTILPDKFRNYFRNKSVLSALVYYNHPKKGIWFSTIYGMVLIINDGDDQITVIQNSNDLYIADKLAKSTIAHYLKHHYFKTGQYMFQLF